MDRRLRRLGSRNGFELCPRLHGRQCLVGGRLIVLSEHTAHELPQARVFLLQTGVETLDTGDLGHGLVGVPHYGRCDVMVVGVVTCLEREQLS